MSRSRLFALLMVCFALPVALAACGGDDDDDGGGGGGEEDAVVEAIETASTSTDPEHCTTLLTQNFLDQTQGGDTGAEAVAECEEDATDSEGDPDSVEVSNVSIDGESATAEAAFTGGDIDGSTIAMSLVKEGDQWKIDSFDEVVEFNAEAVRTAFLDSIAAESDLTPEQVSCIEEQITAASDDQLEPILLGDSSGFEEIVAPC